MKKILLSSLTIFSAVALVATGSFALFSDVESIPDNTIGTGTLELTLNHSAGKPFTVSNAYPGYTTPWEYMDIYNTGSLPFEAQLSVAKTSGNNALWNNLLITMKTSGWDSDCTNGDAGEQTIYSGNINAFPNGITASAIAYWHLANEDDGFGGPDNIRAGWTERVCQQVGVDVNAGNNVQGRTVVFTETVDALQDDDIAP